MTRFREGQTVREGDFVNASTRSADPADDKDKLVKLEEDGKIDEEFIRYKFPTRKLYEANRRVLTQWSSTRFNITHQGDDIYRYTFIGNENPNFTESNPSPGEYIGLVGETSFSNSVKAPNLGVFLVTGSGSGWVEVENPSGSIQTDVLLSDGSIWIATTNYEWIKPPKLKYIEVEVQAAGGGTAGGGGSVYGAGAGAGGYARKIIPAIDLPEIVPIIVGTGGAAGYGSSTRSVSGGDGGQSVFGDIIAIGGKGTQRASNRTGGVGGSAIGGDVNISGQGGGGGYSDGPAGAGGNSVLGFGGPVIGTAGSGEQGGKYGGGAGGRISTSSTTGRGGWGGDGAVIITEHYL